MSDYAVSEYGDHVSIAESVGSCLEEERQEEENKKSRVFGKDVCDEEEEKDHALTKKDTMQIYEFFKGCIFQNVSNDKLYILRLKKS